ncbi:MAG TPA: polysaccharide deacetylase family protein [Jiangellaceae bacterium]|nr:polysaccharide deacetylase family protein [Jiangellaceae bacterium]
MLVTGVVASLVFVVDNVAGGKVDDVAVAGELPATDQPSEPPTASPSAAADAAVLPPQRNALGAITTTGVPGRTVALTFDDGPSDVYTSQVLDILDAHDVTAIFCVVGAAAQAYPEIIEDIVDGGHTLCDHTVSHDLKLSTRAEEAMRDEIGGTLDSIRAAAPDIEVPFFRAPGGYFSAGVNAVAASYEQEPLGWSVDPRDWKAPGADRIYEVVMGGVTPGSIVLLHDGGGDQSETVAALDDIISALDDAGYEFVIPKT